MDRHLHIISIRHLQAMINHRRSCSPVFMDLESHSSCFHLFCQCSLIRTVSFSKQTNIHRIFFCRLQHPLHVPRSRCTGSRICSVCRTAATSDHGRHSTVQGTIHLLRGDKMNMGIQTSCCQNQPFTSQCFRGSSHSHARCYTIHHTWISRLSDTCDLPVFDPDIRFVDSCIIQHQCIGDHQIQIPVFACSGNRLSHTVPECFSSAKLAFISIRGIVFFHLDHQTGIGKTHFIPGCRTIHHGIFISCYCCTHVVPPVSLPDKSSLFCFLHCCFFCHFCGLCTGQIIQPEDSPAAPDFC